MELKEDDLVFCQVKKIEGTTIFLDVEGGKYLGSLVLSEVAAGRIRNLREYVTINKKIVCKILKISGNNLELSLRRVTAKERQQVLERYKRERALANILKLVGEDSDNIIERIKEDYDLSDFFEEMKTSPKILEEYLSKEKAQKVAQAISEKVEREKKVLKKVLLKTNSAEGLNELKEILNFDKAEIRYLGSSQFSIKVSGENFKEANSKLNFILEEIEKRAKTKKAEFEVLKEK